MKKYIVKIITVSILLFVLPHIHSQAKAFDEPYYEDWVGLWIAEGADFPKFSHFNCCDSYLLITGGPFLIGAASWAGRRWGNAMGEITLDGYKALYNDGHCTIEMKMKDQNTIIASDNMNCGGVNVRFQGNYIRHIRN